MTRRRITPRLVSRTLRRFRSDTGGASMVEFSIVLALFLLLFFALLDFGRLAYNYVLAEKAVQLAARTAAVRPPVCADVPAFNTRPTTGVPSPPPVFGTSCSAGTGVCANVSRSCLASQALAGPARDTVTEIMTRITTLLPGGTQPANLRFSYTYDTIGFLGGPYVPVVNVELVGLEFEFVSPLGALAGLAGGTASTLGDDPIAFPRISVSLTGEDLMQGQP